MLSSTQGTPQSPIRAEIFGLQRFAQHGRSLGATHHIQTDRAPTAVFFPRLRDNLATLRLAQLYIAEQAATGYDLSPAAEWLLDNFHLVEAQSKEVRDGLPTRYFRALPVLRDDPLAGLPRVYGVAWAFVAHTDGAFDEDLLIHYLLAYQDTRELTLGEMWALPTTLRVVLIENLRRLAERVATHKAAREVANLVADDPAAYPLHTVIALHAALQGRGGGQMFLAQLWLRVQALPAVQAAELQGWLQHELPQPALAQAQHIANQAADNLSVSNAIHALRAIGGADWPDIVARSSRLMGLMLQAPSFTADATGTRDQALHAIEALARTSARSEVEVAQALLRLMQAPQQDSAANAATDEPRTVAAYWLQGAGRPTLAAALGMQLDTVWVLRSVMQRVALPVYLASLVMGTAGVMWLVWRASAGLPPAGLPPDEVARPLWFVALALMLMVLPASEAVVAIINRLISESARPVHLPRLAFSTGIPAEHRVLVAIPAMLTTDAAVESAVHRLHLHHLANREEAAQFVLLSDWADAPHAHLPGDQALLDLACNAMSALNDRYPVAGGCAPRFIVLHRQRQHSEGEQAWIGWERKRGKLALLLAAMAERAPSRVVDNVAVAAVPSAEVADAATGFMDLGELSLLARGTPYLVTLDADTEMPPGRLRELVAIAAHPQNRPQLDTSGRCVKHGWGILQPRVATPLPEQPTPFHWLFAGQCGIDPYSAASSEVYQDVFGEGSFSGKGLMHVQAVHAVLAQRLPDNQVLSHDLLEGSLVRCAVATDVSVLEDAPFHADVAASRLHRWTRGDWQLLPFLLQPQRYRLSAINRWKMVDNLRRSLVAPASLALLVLALMAPGSARWLWPLLALVLAAFTAGPLMGAMAGLAPTRDDIAKRFFYRQAGTEVARALGGGLWHVSHLLANALMSVDAITRALWRMAVSRRLLLQWTTAAAAQAAAQSRLADVLRAHWSEPAVAALLAFALWASGTVLLPLGLALCGLWALAPVFTWWASRPRPSSADEPMTEVEQAELASIARDSWRFFERCVGPQDRHLPPDNLQTDPHDLVAHRTSPTNIGLYLLSTACARQFGWIGTQELVQRLQATLATLDTLERCHGHFLNWYDTQTGSPLLPRYVSSVDSGNLSGHLLAVAQACRRFASADEPAAQATARALALSHRRLAPLLARFAQVLPSLSPGGQGAWVRLLALTQSGWPEATGRGPAGRVDMTELLHAASEELMLLWPPGAAVGPDRPTQLAVDEGAAVPSQIHPPSAREQLAWCLADHLATVRSAWLDLQALHAQAVAVTTAVPALQPELESAPAPEPDPRVETDPAAATTGQLHALATHCERLAWEADFACLYHPRRRLMHLGLRVAEQELDAGLYDLLASESRLTSLLAIAKADVPVGHWAALGRPFHAVGSTAALRSWSGSMFEYLMPGLVLAEPRGSVLRSASEAAVIEQISFGRSQQLPWGVSESAYAARDSSLAYQYAPQGVPRLALRRTPPEERVVAPYASVMAGQIAPRRALANLGALSLLGARQRYGYIEALDYSAARLNGSSAFTPVNTFMAHHQGMGIVAAANALFDGVAQRWCMATPPLQAVASLLHERPPREMPAHIDVPASLPQYAALALQSRTPGPLREVIPGAQAVEPTHVLGNGSYSVTLRPNGAGNSRWRGLNINRSRDDALRDALGSFFYLRLAPGQPPVSITQHPAPDAQAEYSSTFHADRVCFDAAWPAIRAHTTVWVSPEDDVEFRRIDLYNSGDDDAQMELISAFEVSLADARADEAHPAFSNLFVSAQWRADSQALVFERRPRQSTELALCMAHFLIDGDGAVQSLQVQTDRALWWGRNQGASQVRAQLLALPVATAVHPHDAAEPVVLDTGLDPMCALAVRVRVKAQGQVRLTFATAATPHAATLSAVIDKYRQPSHVQRASLMSATLMGIRLRSMNLSAQNFAALQSLTTAMVMTLTRPGAGRAMPLLVPAAVAAPLPGLGLTMDVASGSEQGSAHTAAPTAICDRRLLWRLGISGDRPLFLISMATVQGLPLLRTLAQVLRLWAWGGIACDLVVVNAEVASYDMPLHREAGALRDRLAADTQAAVQPGGPAGQAVAPNSTTALFLLRAEELSPGELSTLHSLARVHLQADGRPLRRHVQAWLAAHEAELQLRSNVSTAAVAVARAPAAPVAAPQGEFNADSGAFEFDVHSLLRPARPWINVLANPDFGCHVSEAGGGHTWAVNSRLNQLTAWSNDPVADPASDCWLLQDTRSGEVWSLVPSPHAHAQARYRVQHGQGSTRISHRLRRAGGDIEVVLTWCVDTSTAVKQVQVRVNNQSTRALHWRLVGLVEWQMGAVRADRACVSTALVRQRLGPASQRGDSDGKLSVLLATQQEYSAGFGGGTAFFAMLSSTSGDVGLASRNDSTGRSSERFGHIVGDSLSDQPVDGAGDRHGAIDDWTCDRREFFDARGRLVVPDHLGQRAGAGLDPCAAMTAQIQLAPGAATEAVFLLGYAGSPDAARRLATQAAGVAPDLRLQQARAQWNDLLQATEVRTPDPLFDALVNRWLLYQTVSCRLWAKAGFYQAGGATGFRDQLQDTLALSWAAPQMLRAQIVQCAGRQFAQGDVQHWWHAPSGAGVRTHFSDDLLWLPWACVHHLRSSGDAGVLDELVPFLEGREIAVGAEDAYDTPTTSAIAATVYEHAALTLDRSLAVGLHGLPLMGSGDWNDGMNRVGAEGRGESVWLAWFLCKLVDDFAPLAQARGDGSRAQRWLQAALGWRAALQSQGWDGAWYRRAFFDDGSPLGAAANAEARIDLIAQAWSVLSGAAPIERQHQATQAMHGLLVDEGNGLVRLLDPPLRHAEPSAGYIQAYPPGVRENGGQYSHGGVWALMAQAQLVRAGGAAGSAPVRPADADLPYQYFTYLSPAHRAAHPQWGAVYGAEPYVMAGDVCSQPPHTGRGGWSWYTGAAGWMHRAAVESIFGLEINALDLQFRPALPLHWPSAELTLRRNGRRMHFTLLRGTAVQALLVASARGARLMAVGEKLLWPDLPADSSFVIPLNAA